MHDKKITINDIAREAGVSKTTVSRFINKKYASMSEDTRKRISDVIEKHEYRPNKNAQNLKAKNTKIIGCIIADITNSFYTNIVKGINDVCLKRGYHVFFVNTDNDKENEINSIESLLDYDIDGLAINTMGKNDDLLIQINDTSTPIVLVDRYLETSNNLDLITSENYMSTFLCLKYLFDEGYERIYFVSDKIGYNINRSKRESAFKSILKEREFLDIERYIYYNVERDNNLSIMYLEQFISKTIHKEKDEKVCFFVVNEKMLLKFVTASTNLNYKIGQDYGVASYDDPEWGKLVEPGITAISQNTYHIGTTVATQLIERIENNKSDMNPAIVKIPTQLIKRGSTKLNNK